MSERWPGGIVRSTPVTPTGPLQNGTAPGIWTMEQAAYWTKQGLWPTAGNTLAVEDVFSTWLYTGTGSAQTITNGIDLAGKGGLVWIKQRAINNNHFLAHAPTVRLRSDTTNANVTTADGVTAFNANGFSIGANANLNGASDGSIVSWTFREAPKFFDVVTYTGNGSTQNIAHNLGVAPGVIIVKSTTNTYSWGVYHRSYPNGYLFLNSINAGDTANAQNMWGNNSTVVAPTSSQFTVGNFGTVNANGETYVAYLYAHDASSDGIIQCGTYTGITGGSPTVTLGWEPQWVMIKGTNPDAGDAYSNWGIWDSMRGMTVGGSDPLLDANRATQEGTTYTDSGDYLSPTATGFIVDPSANNYTINNQGSTKNYIYIAIRRGPMRTPTVGTSVFSPVARTGTGATANVTVNFAPDTAISAARNSGEYMPYVDKLRGPTRWLTWQQLMTNAQSTSYSGEWFTAFTNTGMTLGADNGGGVSVNSNGTSLIQYYFQRAPGFYDTVCYSGIAATRTVNHSLGVVPELIIVKNRGTNGTSWPVWASTFSGTNDSVYLNTTAAKSATGLFTTTPPTSTVFTVGNDSWINDAGYTYVAYLFASCPGVSKVGTFTGTGALQTINCGFTTGARFVLIKRTDSTGDWYVWDSARGITSGNDPYFRPNVSAAEVTGTNYVDTTTSGFQVTAAASTTVNISGGTYIFLAIS